MYSELIFAAGFIGLLFHTKLVRRVIDIEVMSLAGIYLLLSKGTGNFFIILVILTASELSLAVLLLITYRKKKVIK